MKRPLSMTGFGRGECTGGGRKWTVELRSVNHRYLDIKIRISKKYLVLEERIKKEAASYHARGHIDLCFDVVEESSEGGRLKMDLPLAREYHKCLKILQQEFCPDDGPDLATLTSYRDIITPADEVIDPETINEIWLVAKSALISALRSAAEMRENEGMALKKDLLQRVENFGHTINRIEAYLPGMTGKKEAALKERLNSLLQDFDVDPWRLAQEVAVMVDKLDVSEELVRLRSHMKQFESFLELDEPVGRRIDFLLQEFLREINTIASKINDAETAHLIVDLKSELEKMREQGQNLE